MNVAHVGARAHDVGEVWLDTAKTVVEIAGGRGAAAIVVTGATCSERPRLLSDMTERGNAAQGQSNSKQETM